MLRSLLPIYALLLWIPLRADTILSVGGNTSAYFNLGPQILAASLTTSTPYTGVSFFASLFDNTPNNAMGTAYLTTAIGPSATPSSLVDRAPFTIGPGATNLELFTEPVLNPGTYYLVLTGSTAPADFGVLYTPFPNLIAGPGVIEGGRFYSNPGFNPLTVLNPVYPPASTFVTLDRPSDRLLYSVITFATPEPDLSSGVAVVIALILAGRRFQPRRARAK